jgi:hypothetical protein
MVYCDGADALIELSDTDITPRSIAVTLANPGAETGDTSGWTTTGAWEAGDCRGHHCSAARRQLHPSAPHDHVPSLVPTC